MATSAFITPSEVIVPAVTGEQMGEIDRVAIEETGPNLFQMMENAGRNLASHLIEVLGPGWRSHRIVILAGTGGNGGGGVCAGRHLSNRGGDVVVVTSNEDGMGQVPASQLATYRNTLGRVASADQIDSLEPSVVLDALIGYSLGGPPRGAALDLVSWANAAAARIISLDVPSGLDATSGDTPGAHITAAETVTLALPKTGLDAPQVGSLILADIGIPVETYRRVGADVDGSIFGDRYLVPLQPA